MSKKSAFLKIWKLLTQPSSIPSVEIAVKGKQVPYVVFENEDDVTTNKAEALGKRLQDKLSTLWGIYRRPVNQGDIS